MSVRVRPPSGAQNGVDWKESGPPRFDFFKISSFSCHPSKIRLSAWEDLPYYFLLNEYTRLSMKYLPVIFSHVCMEDSAVTVSVKDEPESNRFTQCADAFSMPLQNSYDREAFSVLSEKSLPAPRRKSMSRILYVISAVMFRRNLTVPETDVFIIILSESRLFRLPVDMT